jgi:hypothetical protein
MMTTSHQILPQRDTNTHQKPGTHSATSSTQAVSQSAVTVIRTYLSMAVRRDYRPLFEY